MHTVKQAIIMAAGKGKRMQPITLIIPKPLVRVNGVRMIDTVIQGLLANGIGEIYVVVGYLKEQFVSLHIEYPGLRLIENPNYDICNNLSFLCVVRVHLEDAIILDADLVICNNTVLSPSFSRSCYNCVWTENKTEKWLLSIRAETVVSCSRTGRDKGWQLYSIFRWTVEDGRRLRKHLKTEFEIKNRQIYWDDVALFCYPQEYQLGIMEMQTGEVVEIDNLKELVELDEGYDVYDKERSISNA